MSCRVQWHILPYHPNWVLEVCPACGLSTPSYSWALVVVGRTMGGIYPGQSAARTGCDHWPPNSALHGGSAVQGQGGAAPVWSVAVHWVCWPWGFPGGAGQGQPLPVSCLRHPSWAIKQCEMATTCPGLGDSQGKLSCESRLAATSAWPGAHWSQAVAYLIGFRKLWSVSQDQPFIWKSSLGGPISWMGWNLWKSSMQVK